MLIGDLNLSVKVLGLLNNIKGKKKITKLIKYMQKLLIL